MVFYKEPFFDDHDNQVHFVNIHNLLGIDELNAYLNKHQLMFEPQLEALIGWHSRKPWFKVTDANTQHLVSREGIDFLDKLHYYVQPDKLTTKEGMSHHYFMQVRACAIHQTQEFQANTISSCKWGADPITTMMTIKHYGPVQIFCRVFLLFLAMLVRFLPWYFIIAMFRLLLCHLVVLEAKNFLWGKYCYGLNSIGSIKKM